MLSADPSKLGQELLAVENAGAEAIHWDVMDGNFVDAITFGSGIVEAHRKLSKLRFDVHLMVSDPGKSIEKFASAGADVIIVHQEACIHLHETLSRIKKLGIAAGVALNPATVPETVEYCDDLLDFFLVMSVNPGSSGQTFIKSQLKKIEKLRKMLPDSVEICVDGGITSNTIGECFKSGANSFVSGSFIFKSDNYYDAICDLRRQCSCGKKVGS